MICIHHVTVNNKEMYWRFQWIAKLEIYEYVCYGADLFGVVLVGELAC